MGPTGNQLLHQLLMVPSTTLPGFWHMKTMNISIKNGAFPYVIIVYQRVTMWNPAPFFLPQPRLKFSPFPACFSPGEGIGSCRIDFRLYGGGRDGWTVQLAGTSRVSWSQVGAPGGGETPRGGWMGCAKRGLLGWWPSGHVGHITKWNITML